MTGPSVQIDEISAEIAFSGDPSRVRAFAANGEFGVVANGLAPETAVDLAAVDADADSVWDALANVLRELDDAGCSYAEMIDYIATEKCGFDRDEWASMSNANPDTIRQNGNRAERKLTGEE